MIKKKSIYLCEKLKIVVKCSSTNTQFYECVLHHFSFLFENFLSHFQRKVFHEKNKKIRVNFNTFSTLFFNFSHKLIIFITIFFVTIKYNLKIF